MKITLNGERYDTRAGTVAELVTELGYGGQAVAIEHNEALVPKKLHESTALSEGDALELVTLVGGGNVGWMMSNVGRQKIGKCVLYYSAH